MDRSSSLIRKNASNMTQSRLPCTTWPILDSKVVKLTQQSSCDAALCQTERPGSIYAAPPSALSAVSARVVACVTASLRRAAAFAGTSVPSAPSSVLAIFALRASAAIPSLPSQRATRLIIHDFIGLDCRNSIIINPHGP